MIASIVFLLGCTNPLAVSAPAYRFNPPSWYKDVWNEVGECAGGHVRSIIRFSDVKWYWVDARTFTINGSGVAIGAESGGSIFLSREMLNTRWVVKHEMIHARTGINGHPNDPFSTCGALASQQGTQGTQWQLP
jgi:hypothetical protein